MYLFGYLQQNEFWKIYITKFPRIDVSDFVVFNPKRFSNELKNKDLYIENYEDKKFSEFLETFKKNFDSVEKIDRYHCRLGVKDTKILISYFDTNFVDDGSVDCGDLLDFRNDIEEYSTGCVLTIYSYQYDLIHNFFANIKN